MTGLRRLDLRGDPDGPLGSILDQLARGAPIVYPTETVYGLGGAVSPDAVAEVQRLKGRDGDRPLLLLIDGPDAVPSLAWTETARALAYAFWPGALTLVLSDPGRIFPPGIRSRDTGGVGIRVSPHPFVRRLLAAHGAPLTSTSMNLSGEPPARSGSEAWSVAERMGDVDLLVVDWGTLPSSAPSTVLDCTGRGTGRPQSR